MLSFDRRLARLALFAALGAALMLAGCGRKSMLDPPPASSLPAESAPGAAPPPGQPPAPPAPGTRPLRQRIPLDPLLD